MKDDDLESLVQFRRGLGERVKHLRHEKDLTQEQLAERVDRSGDTISNIERGFGGTRIETIVRIAEALDVEVGDLFAFADLTGHERRRRTAIEALVSLVEGHSDATITVLAEVVAAALRVRVSE